MSNKNKVREKYPDSFAEKFTTNGFNSRSYYLIWEKPNGNQKRRLGEGDTEAQGWKEAWERISETDTK